MSEKNLVDLLFRIIESIKDELLLFALAVIVLLVIYPYQRLWVILIFLITSAFYALIRYFRKEKHLLKQFKKYLDRPESWDKKLHRIHEFWINKEDPLFQIETGENVVEDFRERWMKNYPNMNHNTSYRVYLKYANTIVSDCLFVGLDGYRYMVPVPEREEGKYFYSTDSLQFKLANVVGSFYLYKNLREFAEAHGIEIRNL